MNPREALLSAAQGRAPDAVVAVPAGWIIEALAGDAAEGLTIDLPGSRVAELLGRSPITVAGWCRAGLFPGAYRMRGRREWRIPAAALQSFQRQEAARAA